MNERCDLIEQKITYDWRPTLCNHCQKYWHSEELCKNKRASVMRKATQEVVEYDIQP